RLRGIQSGAAPDPRLRQFGMEQLARQERGNKGNGGLAPETGPTWNELGPRPLPNGETESGTTAAVTGRVSAVVVDPTNSNIVYLGTAQGGVWRSTNGGGTWTTIFDTAASLSIGALALAPSSPTTLYVGTGEKPGSFSKDNFFGVGVYRID